MTLQIPEKLLYKGEYRSMCCLPLSEYFAQEGWPEFQFALFAHEGWPQFQITSTDLWRGYVGSWEIIDDRLYLVGLEGKLIDGTDASLAKIFPDSPDRVFAYWFTGEAPLPRGGRYFMYAHRDYGSVCESDLYLYFVNGVISRTKVVVIE